MMIVQVGSDQIGQYGFSHYTGEPVNSGHDLALVPQSIADGWEGFCSCGEWRAFASFYDYQKRDDLISALKTAHSAHCG